MPTTVEFIVSLKRIVFTFNGTFNHLRLLVEKNCYLIDAEIKETIRIFKVTQIYKWVDVIAETQFHNWKKGNKMFKTCLNQSHNHNHDKSEDDDRISHLRFNCFPLILSTAFSHVSVVKVIKWEMVISFKTVFYNSLRTFCIRRSMMFSQTRRLFMKTFLKRQVVSKK